MKLVNLEEVQKILNKRFNNDRWLDFIVEINSLPIESQWIDVKTTPEKDGMYLVYQNFSKSKVYDEHFIQCLHWDGDTWADGDGQVFDVTYYQPLPLSPK